MIFDVVFPRGTRLPSNGEPPVTVMRAYSPAHNIGHFRYLEASQVLEDGRPSGDITLWDEIRFPFDPAIAGGPLENVPVVRSSTATGFVEEIYTCDATGAVNVAIRNLPANYEREYRLSRWTGKTAAIRPSGAKRVRKASS